MKLITPITDVVILGDMLVQRDFIEARRSPNPDRVVQTPECQFWTGRRPLSSFREHLGEAGIKKTLPALVPRMSYKGLTIGNGAAAVARSATAALGSCSPRKHPAGSRMFTNIDNRPSGLPTSRTSVTSRHCRYRPSEEVPQPAHTFCHRCWDSWLANIIASRLAPASVVVAAEVAAQTCFFRGDVI